MKINLPSIFQARIFIDIGRSTATNDRTLSGSFSAENHITGLTSLPRRFRPVAGFVQSIVLGMAPTAYQRSVNGGEKYYRIGR